MPWLWRPLWGTVWMAEKQAGKCDKNPGEEKPGTKTASGEGEGKVKYRGSMIKWGYGVRPAADYDHCNGETQDQRRSADVAATVGPVDGRNRQTRADGPENDGLSGRAPQDEGVPTGQVADSLSRQFVEVAPGVFQFNRPAPTGWGYPAGAGRKPPVMVDPARHRSALPSAIDGYRLVGQTRDGLPVYAFK